MPRSGDSPARGAPLAVVPTYRNIWKQRFDALTAAIAAMTGGQGGSGQQALQSGTVGPDALSGHTVVTVDDDGKIVPATNTDSAQALGPFWLTTAAAQPGTLVLLTASGSVTEQTWNWQVGPIYVGVDGALTQIPPVAPAYLAALGYATTTTSLVLNRQPSIVLA